MADQRRYQLRQEILKALDACYPGGHDLDGLCSCGKVEDLAATRQEVLAEARVLELCGYTSELRGRSRDPFWKIAQKGVLQIRKETVLVEEVWGEEAL